MNTADSPCSRSGTRLQTPPPQFDSDPTTVMSTDLSNWGMEWWDPGGLTMEELEELDWLLGLDRSSPFPGGTIDPRWLANDDVVQVNSAEGSRIRGSNRGAVRKQHQEERVNIEKRYPTELDTSGSENWGIDASTRTMLRMSPEDEMDKNLLKSQVDRGDKEEGEYQQDTERDSVGTSFSPSEPQNPRDSFSPPQKGKYRGRQQPETPFPPKLTQPTAMIVDVPLPENPAVSPPKRKFTLQQPTEPTLLKQNPSDSELVLKEVPPSSQPKRKYTRRQSKVACPRYCAI
jgi:hypothetical protein